MELVNTLFIAVALAMDALAVSISSGASLIKTRLKDVLLISFYFGFFQFFMPLLGWGGGNYFNDLLKSFDHWLAFGLLFFIGGKMIAESFKKEKNMKFVLSHKLLIVLAISTSIDALGIGFSYALLDKAIFIPAVIIGLVAFLFSAVGTYLGKILKNIFKNKTTLVGGIILIIIGIKILFDHGVF